MTGLAAVPPGPHVAVIDGALRGPAEAVVGLADRGFQYGDGLFETIAVMDGRPLFWEAHLERLERGAAILGIPSPGHASWEADAASLPSLSGRCVWKLILTRGPGGRGYAPPVNPVPTRILWQLPWPVVEERLWRQGVRADFCRTPLASGAPHLAVKSLSRLDQVMARRELPADCAEGILSDRTGAMREGTMSNLFWVDGTGIVTPRLDDGGIVGIMRAAVIQRLREEGMGVREADSPRQALAAAQEAFFTNSLIGVWPLAELAGRTYPGAGGAIASRLLKWIATLGLGAGSG